jgi:MFS family permease
MIILLINNYPSLKYPIEFQGLLSGFIALSFWVSMDVMTAKTTDNESRGRQQSSIYFGMWSASILAPFIGGFLISRFGYSFMFIISLLLVLSGGIISFFLKLDVPVSKKFNFISMNSKIMPHLILVFLRGITFTIASFLVPVFIYRITGSEIIIGSFGLLTGIMALLATTVIGIVTDKHRHFFVLFFLGAGLLWSILSFGNNKSIYAVFLIANYFMYSGISSGLNVLFFNAIEKMDAITMVSERMIAFSLGGIISLSAALFFDYRILFIICAISIAVSIPVLRKVLNVS